MALTLLLQTVAVEQERRLQLEFQMGQYRLQPAFAVETVHDDHGEERRGSSARIDHPKRHNSAKEVKI